MAEQWVGALVAALAICFAIFQAQPPPPQSPLLYQWETVHSHKTKYKGHTIFYKDLFGLANNSENIVILHGFPTSSFDFHLLTNSLRRSFSRTVFIDFLGHGFSDKPRNHSYSLLEQTNIVEHVLERIGLYKFHIISHDYGGSIALELLTRRRLNPLDYMFEIRSIGIISPALFSNSYRETWSMFLLRLPFVGSVAIRLANRISYAKELDEIFGEQKLDDFTLKQMWYFARYNEEYRAWPSILLYIAERRKLERRWIETLQTTRIPVCLFHGPADPILPYYEIRALYAEYLPKISVEKLADNVGHYPHLEDPVGFMERYAQFLVFKVGLKLQQQQTVVVLPKKIPQPSSEAF